MAYTQMQERILLALQAARLSQAALARYCGVSRQMPTYWLHPDPAKRIDPAEEHLQCIADATGVSVAWLKGLSRDSGAPAAENHRDARAALRYRHSRAARFDRAVREAIMAQAPGFAEYFGKRLRLAAIDTLMWFDWVGRHLVADLCYVREVGPGAVTGCRARLWQLTVLRHLEHEFGIERRYMLVAVPMGTEPAQLQDMDQTVAALRAEAGALGLSLVVSADPEEVAKSLIERERTG